MTSWLRVESRAPALLATASLTRRAADLRADTLHIMVQVFKALRLQDETLHLSVLLFDRVLSEVVDAQTEAGWTFDNALNTGIACLVIAGKYEEQHAPDLDSFADGQVVNKGDLLRAEARVLRTLRWRLSQPTGWHFLHRLQCAPRLRLSAATQWLAMYILELSLAQRTPFRGSALAAAAVLLAAHLQHRSESLPVAFVHDVIALRCARANVAHHH